MTRSWQCFMFQPNRICISSTLKLLFAFIKHLALCANYYPCSLWNMSLNVKLHTRRCWCFQTYVLDFFKNSFVYMQRISSSNKALVCPLANPPIWPASLWLETPSRARVHFLWASSSPSLFLASTLDDSQKSEGLYFLKQVTSFSVSGIALVPWLSNWWPQSTVRNTFYITIEPTSGVCVCKLKSSTKQSLLLGNAMNSGFAVSFVSFFKRCFLRPTKLIPQPTNGLGPIVWKTLL